MPFRQLQATSNGDPRVYCHVSGKWFIPRNIKVWLLLDMQLDTRHRDAPIEVLARAHHLVLAHSLDPRDLLRLRLLHFGLRHQQLKELLAQAMPLSGRRQIRFPVPPDAWLARRISGGAAVLGPTDAVRCLIEEAVRPTLNPQHEYTGLRCGRCTVAS